MKITTFTYACVLGAVSHTTAGRAFMASSSTFSSSSPPRKSISAFDRRDSVKWSSCGVPSLTDVQCTNISVPVDYESINGAKIPIAVARINAVTQPAKGSIYFNPGGPGASAIDTALEILEAQQTVILQLIQEYNFVAIDPRGAGHSQPLRCDPQLWNKRVPMLVSNDAEYNALIAHWTAVGQSCKAMTGTLFDNLDTRTVAKDFELVRQALGDSKLNYIGTSYGAQLGYTYAQLFPSHVGRMALDGVYEHALPPAASIQSEATSFEATLEQFFSWCAANSSCALHSAGAGVPDLFRNLSSAAMTAPIAAPSCAQTGPGACQPSVGFEDLLSGVQAGLLTVQPLLGGLNGWVAMSEALLNASRGDASALSAAWYTQDTDLAGDWVEIAVSCQDFLHPVASLQDVLAVERMALALSPTNRGVTQAFRAFVACAAWPANVTNPQSPISVKGAPKMLLSNSLYDPETSVAGAVDVKQMIGNANLVFRNGSGHTSWYLGGDTALAINAFIVNGTMPEDGTVYQS